MKKIVKYIWFPFLFPILFIRELIRHNSEETYYVTGTGRCKVTGERMFFKTIMHTRKGFIPLLSIEKKMDDTLQRKSCIVLFFQKISAETAEFAHKEYDIELQKEQI